MKRMAATKSWIKGMTEKRGEPAFLSFHPRPSSGRGRDRYLADDLRQEMLRGLSSQPFLFPKD